MEALIIAGVVFVFLVWLTLAIIFLVLIKDNHFKTQVVIYTNEPLRISEEE